MLRRPSPAITGLIGGPLDVVFSNFPLGIAPVKSGKLRALAVAGAAHHAMRPAMPTTAEAGAPQLPGERWTAIMATPDRDERARAQGLCVDARGRQAFGKCVGDEVHRWSRIIATAKITTERGATARSASAGIGACRADRGCG